MGGDAIDVEKSIRIRHYANRSRWREAFKECELIAYQEEKASDARRNDAKRGLEEIMEEQLRRDALEYHRVPTYGKISVTPTKSLVCPRLFPRRRLRVSRHPGRPERSGHADIAR
jgi:hypothetical protein